MKFKHIFILTVTVLILMLILTGCNNAPSDDGTSALQNETVAETFTDFSTEIESETYSEAEAESDYEITTQIIEAETTDSITVSEWQSAVDFIVEVETGRDVRVLQLTDTQIIDASQQRSATRLDAESQVVWGKDKTEDNYKKYVRDVITKTEPDFIFITGDVVYGEFDDDGSALLEFIDFMESFGIPWAPVFGNHDNESKMGADWQCEQLEKAEHCLFLQRELTGNGNYTVGIVQGGILERVFFMMDSNGCGAISTESLKNKHSTSNVGFTTKQTKWFTETAQAIKDVSPDTNISFAFHIQLNIFTSAFEKYGFTNSNTVNNPINIDTIADKAETDFGYIGRDLKSPWDNGKVWDAIKATGADSIFVGHEHCNSASVIYDGIRLQYGQKSSTYDRVNYLQSNGAIEGGYLLYGTPMVGGTLMNLKEGTGEIIDSHIVLADADERSKPSGPEANYTYTYDFNGTDFNTTVTTDALDILDYATLADTFPEGADGGVYSAQSTNLVCVGVKIADEIEYDKLSSMKIRMYVEQKTSPSKNTLFRLYDAKTNSIRSDKTYASYGGKVGEWCEIDITESLKSAGLVKNGIVQPFTIVYRCYDADSVVYFDSIIVSTSEEIK